MPIFQNPFLAALLLHDEGRDMVFRNSMGGVGGTLHQLGHAAFLRDQFGQHLGSIQHFTHDTQLVCDHLGTLTGSIHDTGHGAVIRDPLGHIEATVHEMGEHHLVRDGLGHLQADIHQEGGHISATDALGHQLWSAVHT